MEPVLDRTDLVTVIVILALAPLTVRGLAGESVGGGHPLGRCPSANGRDLRIAPVHVACALTLAETGLDPRIDTGLAETALGVTAALAFPCSPGEVVVTARGRDLPRCSRGRSPPSSDRSWSKERGRRARREQQEGVETVNVSQAPAVSEVPAAVVPPAGGATMATLPSAVQDLARSFLNLAGSSSLGAVGGVACAPASAVPFCSWW